MKDFLLFIAKISPLQFAFAHCDIPCGIYDPHAMQMAAHTVIRMTGLINDLTTSSKNPDFEERKKIIHQIARFTRVKDEHAELVKHELRVLWGDYFKPEHLKEYPDLHEIVFQTLKLASKARQEVNIEVAQALLANTQKIAEIFFKTKSIESVRVKAPYPTGGEIILHT